MSSVEKRDEGYGRVGKSSSVEQRDEGYGRVW